MRIRSTVLLLTALFAAGTSFAEAPVRSTYIVQGKSAEAASQRLRSAGVETERELGVINAVAAQLTPMQLAALEADSSVRVFEDRQISPRGLFSSLGGILGSNSLIKLTQQATTPIVSPLLQNQLTSSLTSPLVKGLSAQQKLQDGKSFGLLGSLLYETNYPALIGADSLQSAGITGKGVTIAVLDTGFWQDVSQNYGNRVLASIDVTNNGNKPIKDDPYGHGTHVTAIAASGAQSLNGSYSGIAPSANLVLVRAFNGEGAGRYTDVIAGVNWIVANRAKYKIRVLNLSFGAPPASYYWDDPLNQAVMAAWRAGIVVVVSAGNEGPSPMTISVPGNVPYVITVGALTDNNTPYNATDDRLASFSSTGPTYEGFVKPEMVAPGGHIAASMSSNSYLARLDNDSMNLADSLFTMSGTSQAAAVTTGVVALMLQADPSLTPDTVKCRLLASTRPAINSQGKLAYSVFQQGAGLINAVAAVNSSATGCANRGLNLQADLDGSMHFGGPANMDDVGNYVIMDMEGGSWGDPLDADGFTWSRGYVWGEGYTWSDGYTWSRGFTWSKGFTWSRGFTWSKGFTWSRGYTWSRSVSWWDAMSTSFSNGARSASIATWVPNE